MKQTLLNLIVNHFEFLVISILVFLFLLILVFRQPITGFIQRITSFSALGVKATASPVPQNTADTKELIQKETKNFIEDEEAGNSVVFQNLKGKIMETLRERGLETQGITIKVLVKHLAATTILLKFEETYGLIFGSQINLLKKMNENKTTGITKQEIQLYFKQAQKKYPGAMDNANFDSYLMFLILHDLIVQKDDKYYLSEHGVEYLIWMIRFRKAENKAF